MIAQEMGGWESDAHGALLLGMRIVRIRAVLSPFSGHLDFRAKTAVGRDGLYTDIHVVRMGFQGGCDLW